MTEKNEPHADPMIDEIRAIRRELSEEFGNDVVRLGRHLQELERKSDRMIETPAKTSTKPARPA